MNRNLGGVTGDHMQAHHLIPDEIWGKHQTFFDDIGMKGRRGAKENGLLIPGSEEKVKSAKRKFYRCGPRAIYSTGANLQVDRIESAFKCGAIDAAQARDKISQLQNASRILLMSPGANPIRLT
ncbi:AHH domain-containing protein [Burkholderia cepacia]|uniref:AHH domain-containing protein n=1 Tax=Burkholderia cepacia TaxID=292 RepID=UPI00249D9928|nr:AHH domain-containing protein [Burkholderia cepacia]